MNRVLRSQNLKKKSKSSADTLQAVPHTNPVKRRKRQKGADMFSWHDSMIPMTYVSSSFAMSMPMPSACSRLAPDFPNLAESSNKMAVVHSEGVAHAVAEDEQALAEMLSQDCPSWMMIFAKHSASKINISEKKVDALGVKIQAVDGRVTSLQEEMSQEKMRTTKLEEKVELLSKTGMLRKTMDRSTNGNSSQATSSMAGSHASTA